jgi:hypothetical protein
MSMRWIFKPYHEDRKQRKCKPDPPDFFINFFFAVWLLLESLYTASTILEFSLNISKKKKLNYSKIKKALFWVPDIASNWTKSTLFWLPGATQQKLQLIIDSSPRNSHKRDKHVCEVKETIWIWTSFCTKYTYCCKVFFVCLRLYFGVLFRASWWRRTRGDYQASQEQLFFKFNLSKYFVNKFLIFKDFAFNFCAWNLIT